MKKKAKAKAARWTAADEEILINNVRENVTNLAKAFRQTSKELQRSTLACSAHWYANTSIKSGHCLFVTLSGKHVSVNRKNGKGKSSTMPLYKRVLKILGLSL